jgi:predicted enzyme related to lactoylglutathione lyase
MIAPIVFFDIAGPDLGKLNAFYAEVFGWPVTPNPVFPDASANLGPLPVTAPLPGMLRKEEAGHDPQFAKVIYLGVEDVTAALDRVLAHGGSVHQPRFVVPGVVILGLFKDPAGNVMGLVETWEGKPVVP